MVVSGARPRLRWVNLGMTILTVDALVGLLFMPMGRISALWQGLALLLAIGLLGGYMQVTVFTWIQRRVAPAMLGRAICAASVTKGPRQTDAAFDPAQDRRVQPPGAGLKCGARA